MPQVDAEADHADIAQRSGCQKPAKDADAIEIGDHEDRPEQSEEQKGLVKVE